MLLVLMGILFVSMLQPMFMIGILILIILLYSFFVNMFLEDYWFSYALIMVMLSGVMVVFTYLISLIPNENFESYNLLYLVVMIMFLIGSYYTYIYNYKCNLYSVSLWSSFISMFNMSMVMILLLVMLVVVWFSYIGYGALRVN